MKNKNLETTSPLIPNPLKETAGILLIDKPRGRTSFSLVSSLRRLYGVKTIGHAGTLDPFATGVMILLVGRSFTRLSDHFLHQDKEYTATLRLGITTDSYDCEGKTLSTSDKIPTLEEILEVLKKFQGTLMQTPPMFSAKKVQGKKLYELARQGITIERAAKEITLSTQFISYEYPFLKIHVQCSKGTYIRTIAYDIGEALGTGAHLSELSRTRCGPFHLKDCIDGSLLNQGQTPELFPLRTLQSFT